MYIYKLYISSSKRSYLGDNELTSTPLVSWSLAPVSHFKLL